MDPSVILLLFLLIILSIVYIFVFFHHSTQPLRELVIYRTFSIYGTFLGVSDLKSICDIRRMVIAPSVFWFGLLTIQDGIMILSDIKMPPDSVGQVSSVGRAFVCETVVSIDVGSNLTSVLILFLFLIWQ